jgi:hypothetical protein
LRWASAGEEIAAQFLIAFLGCVVSDDGDCGIHALVYVAVVGVSAGFGERKAERFSFSVELCFKGAVRILR